VAFVFPAALAALFIVALNADPHSKFGNRDGGLLATVGIWTVAISLILVFAGFAVRSRRSWETAATTALGLLKAEATGADTETMRAVMAAAIALAFCAGGCGATGGDEHGPAVSGKTRIVRIKFGEPADRVLRVPQGCPGLLTALYCNPAALHAPPTGRAAVKIERSSAITTAAEMPGAAQAGGSALIVGREIVFRGRERGGVAYVVSRSGVATIVGRFRNLGLDRGGSATVSLVCRARTPTLVLGQPSGRRLYPDLQVISYIPDTPETRQYRAPDVCTR
jgi:hypothetical protein